MLSYIHVFQRDLYTGINESIRTYLFSSIDMNCNKIMMISFLIHVPIYHFEKHCSAEHSLDDKRLFDDLTLHEIIELTYYVLLRQLEEWIYS